MYVIDTGRFTATATLTPTPATPAVTLTMIVRAVASR